MSFTLHGLPVSQGIAIGRAMLMSHATLEVSHLTLAPRMVDKEIARFDAAIKAVKSELETMRETTENAPAELAAYMKREYDIWERVVKKAGIKPE